MGISSRSEVLHDQISPRLLNTGFGLSCMDHTIFIIMAPPSHFDHGFWRWFPNKYSSKNSAKHHPIILSIPHWMMVWKGTTFDRPCLQNFTPHALVWCCRQNWHCFNCCPPSTATSSTLLMSIDQQTSTVMISGPSAHHKDCLFHFSSTKYQCLARVFLFFDRGRRNQNVTFKNTKILVKNQKQQLIQCRQSNATHKKHHQQIKLTTNNNQTLQQILIGNKQQQSIMSTINSNK